MRPAFFFSALLLGGCAVSVAGNDSAITIGKNVQVSASRPNVSHVEVILAADPANANRLLACSFAWTGGGVIDSSPGSPQAPEMTYAYASSDGGQSWSPSISQPPGSWDPDCVFGDDGKAYFVSGLVQRESARLLYADSSGKWTHHFDFTINDRPWVGVRGEEVALGLIAGPGGHPVHPNTLFRISYDGGKTFGPQLPARLRGKPMRFDDNTSHPVFFSDGTLFAVIPAFQSDCEGTLKLPPFHPAPRELELTNMNRRTTAAFDCLYALALKPHAQVAQLFPIATQYRRGGTIESLAVDPGSALYKDRAYVVWSDDRTGRQRIYLAYSRDRAKSWSTPVPIDDGPWRNPLADGPDNIAPSIAVNRNGVVVVTWQDRRENPDDLGYYLRASASLDGGNSWLPSVRVSESPNQFDKDDSTFGLPALGAPAQAKTMEIDHRVWITEGHTLGLAASRDNIFHALWVDDRTGILQVWTAPIRVAGTVTQNGDPSLAGLNDVTESVQLYLYDAKFDRAAGTATAVLQLKNSGRRPLSNLNVRVLNAYSAFADISPQMAILPFPGSLQPHGLSSRQSIQFKLTNLRPEQDGDYSVDKLLDLRLRVFAHPL